jgi:hypothetical protein
MDSIDRATLVAFSLEQLVERMDAVLLQSNHERYSYLPKDFPRQEIPLVSQLMITKKLAILSDDSKRAVAHIAFAYLAQMACIFVSSGFTNNLHHNSDEKTSWLSPTFQIQHGMVRQYQITASRTLMDIFMDLLYCIENGHRIGGDDSKLRKQGKHSKLVAFRIWLCEPQNPFNYFAHTVLETIPFSKNFRDPEVHGELKLPKRLLLLQKPTPEEMQEPFQLINSALLNSWRPLIDISNGKKPSYIVNASDKGREWFEVYRKGSNEEIKQQLSSMFPELTPKNQ